MRNLLVRMGEKDLAQKLLNDFKAERVRIGPLEGGVRAETAPFIWSGPNRMTLNQAAIETEIPDRAGNDDKNVIAWALTVRHEYEHMRQTNPDQTPEFEDDAWRETVGTGARWYRQITREFELTRQQPDSPERLDTLRELRKLLSGVGDGLVDEYQNLQGAEGEIAAGHVSQGIIWPGVNGPSRDITALNREIQRVRNADLARIDAEIKKATSPAAAPAAPAPLPLKMPPSPPRLEVSPRPAARGGASLTLQLPGFWGHLNYTVTGAEFEAPTGSDRGNVGGRHYVGQLVGSELVISGTAVSDNESSGAGSGDYYELTVSATVGKETRNLSYIAPKGEKLSRPFTLSVPIDPAAVSGAFQISLLEQNQRYGPHGWVVSGALSNKPVAKPITLEPAAPLTAAPRPTPAAPASNPTPAPVAAPVVKPRGSNLALGKGAQQSSVSFGGDAARAADGNTDGGYFNNSVANTASESQPWWQVDLGAVQRVGTIRIWNRTDCCGERLSNFDVFVSDAPLPPGGVDAARNAPGVSQYRHPGAAGRTTDIEVNRTGRYVRVQLEGTDYLQLAEVEVLGSPSADTTTAARQPCASETTLFTNGNAGGVGNAPTSPTRFTLSEPAQVESVMTYHWNGGRGQAPGAIAVQREDGTRYGPWQVVGEPGQGGVPNAYWYARPRVVLPPGTYTVLDSHPASWAQNAQTGGQGIVTVKGCRVP